MKWDKSTDATLTHGLTDLKVEIVKNITIVGTILLEYKFPSNLYLKNIHKS